MEDTRCFDWPSLCSIGLGILGLCTVTALDRCQYNNPNVGTPTAQIVRSHQAAVTTFLISATASSGRASAPFASKQPRYVHGSSSAR